MFSSKFYVKMSYDEGLDISVSGAKIFPEIAELKKFLDILISK